MLFCGQEWEEKRRQNIEKMNEEMERIAEYERGQRVWEIHWIKRFVKIVTYQMTCMCSTLDFSTGHPNP